MIDLASMTDPNPQDVLCRTAELPWSPFGAGIEFKVLRVSAETGVWTVLFRCASGSSFPPHFHHGAGEYLMLKGSMDYRAGTARAGDYGYEPLGALHESTTFPEDSELWFSNHGPVAFLNSDGSIATLLDWRFFAERMTPPAAAGQPSPA